MTRRLPRTVRKLCKESAQRIVDELVAVPEHEAPSEPTNPLQDSRVRADEAPEADLSFRRLMRRFLHRGWS